ncbi:MAG TPA: NAD(P)/FAD-dependent oxidoreductase [Steroidobacteraceae bacterium]|jgi:kynurenine 3-monooxygenase
MNSRCDPQPVSILGAGLAGTLLAILLARRGDKVQLFERLPDMRRTAIPAGRSINLALAARGIHALEMAGIMEQVLPLLIPMPGRMLHTADGTLTFVPYGQGEHEVIFSVSRPGLNSILLDAAEAAGVELRFRQSALAGDFGGGEIVMGEEGSGATTRLPMQRVIAADGAGSVLRRSLATAFAVDCSEDLLEHGYKELRLPSGSAGHHQIHKNALHIWPRGGFMLIALPNLDGSFTVTLFLPRTGPESFAALDNANSIRDFFARHFPDILEMLPGLAEEFLQHPTGIMGTVHCQRWSVEDRMLLIGDAAHAITPFHGQGMNCAFEDCRELVQLLDARPDWATAFADFEHSRRPNTDAIAQMAIENYREMRDTVRDPKFQLQKTLSLELERRFTGQFVPRYSMVMFHDEIPYSTALQRGRIQSEILATLTRAANTLDEVDYQTAADLIGQRLPPI